MTWHCLEFGSEIEASDELGNRRRWQNSSRSSRCSRRQKIEINDSATGISTHQPAKHSTSAALATNQSSIPQKCIPALDSTLTCARRYLAQQPSSFTKHPNLHPRRRPAPASLYRRKHRTADTALFQPFFGGKKSVVDSIPRSDLSQCSFDPAFPASD
jgi:hypothetical protein